MRKLKATFVDESHVLNIADFPQEAKDEMKRILGCAADFIKIKCLVVVMELNTGISIDEMDIETWDRFKSQVESATSAALASMTEGVHVCY